MKRIVVHLTDGRRWVTPNKGAVVTSQDGVLFISRRKSSGMQLEASFAEGMWRNWERVKVPKVDKVAERGEKLYSEARKRLEWCATHQWGQLGPDVTGLEVSIRLSGFESPHLSLEDAMREAAIQHEVKWMLRQPKEGRS